MSDGGSKTGGLLGAIKDDPATKKLVDDTKKFAVAQAGHVVSTATTKITDKVTKPKDKGPVTSDKDKDDRPETAKTGAIKSVVESAQEGAGPLKLLGKGISGALKGAFKKKGGSNKRPTNITDVYWVGLPARSVYNQWTQWEAFPGFMKGPVKVSVKDDYTESSWQAKIFLNNRSWKATTQEMTPDQRIKWTTEGAKGTIDGVVTFHQVADRLTLMIFVLEYRPKGFFEWWGNRWRTVGRRYRLDVKHFRRFLMMQGEESGEWRGVIEEGELTKTHDDAKAEEDQENDEGQEETDEIREEDDDDTAAEEGGVQEDAEQAGEADEGRDPESEPSDDEGAAQGAEGEGEGEVTAADADDATEKDPVEAPRRAGTRRARRG